MLHGGLVSNNYAGRIPPHAKSSSEEVKDEIARYKFLSKIKMVGYVICSNIFIWKEGLTKNQRHTEVFRCQPR